MNPGIHEIIASKAGIFRGRVLMKERELNKEIRLHSDGLTDGLNEEPVSE